MMAIAMNGGGGNGRQGWWQGDCDGNGRRQRQGNTMELLLPLDAPPSCLPRLVIASLCCLHCLSMCRLIVTSPLIVPPSHLPPLRLSHHPSSHHCLSRHQLAIMLPLVVPPTCLPWLVAASPLNAVTITHCHRPTVHCTVAAVAYCNCATIINSLCIDFWPLSPIAAADNMAITVTHSRIPLLSWCPLHHRRHCRPSRLCCCTYWHKHCCVTPCCTTKSLCAGR